MVTRFNDFTHEGCLLESLIIKNTSKCSLLLMLIIFFRQFKSQVWGCTLTIRNQQVFWKTCEEKHRHAPREKRPLIIEESRCADKAVTSRRTRNRSQGQRPNQFCQLAAMLCASESAHFELRHQKALSKSWSGTVLTIHHVCKKSLLFCKH